MVRLIVALMVAVTMLVNPAIASAARAECDRHEAVAATWPGDESAAMPAMPCCDHDKSPPACAKICDLYQSTSLAVSAAPAEPPLHFFALGPEPVPGASARHFAPGTLDPPPRRAA